MSVDMHTDTIGRVVSAASYSVSGGLMLGHWLQWLNDNAGAIGAIMAIATFGINWFYQHQRYKKLSRK